MSPIPESHADLLVRDVIWHVATIGPNGEPQSSPVWAGWDGEHITFSLTTDRQKYKNLVANPSISVSGLDPDEPGRYLEIRGVVARIDDDADGAFIDSMAMKYEGRAKNPYSTPGEQRVVIMVKPSHCTHRG